MERINFKNFVFVLIISIVFSFVFSPVAFGAKKKSQSKHKIEFVTKDKFILVGDLYLSPSQSQKPLVVCLHSFSLNALAWSNLAKALQHKGYNVLAMDLRGHGRSVYNENLKLKSRYKFSNSDWQKLPNDVIESIAYIKSHYPHINCNNIIFVGADVGASAGVIAGNSLNPKPSKFVMVSPMLNFKGLYIPIKVANYTNTKFLVILSKSDKILFNFYTKDKPIIIKYPIGGPGNQLLKVNPSSVSDIVNFIAAP